MNHSLNKYNVVATQLLGSIRDALLRRASELSLGRFLSRSVTFVSPLPLEMVERHESTSFLESWVVGSLQGVPQSG